MPFLFDPIGKIGGFLRQERQAAADVIDFLTDASGRAGVDAHAAIPAKRGHLVVYFPSSLH